MARDRKPICPLALGALTAEGFPEDKGRDPPGPTTAMEARGMTRCLSCGHTNRPDRRFCAECETRLSLACAACGATNEPGEKLPGGQSVPPAFGFLVEVEETDARVSDPVVARDGPARRVGLTPSILGQWQGMADGLRGL